MLFLNSWKKKRPDDALSGYCSFPLPFRSEKLPSDHFLGAFNASSLNQTEQTIHYHDDLTLYYTPE